AIRSWAIARGLGRMGPKAVPVLTDLLPDRSVRTVVVATLGEMRSDASSAVPSLTSRLDDENWWTRKMVCAALAKSGAPARSAIPALLKTYEKDENFKVRDEAALTIWRIDSRAAAAAGITGPEQPRAPR